LDHIVLYPIYHHYFHQKEYDYICAAFPASIKKVLSESNFAIVHFFRIDMMKRIAIDCLLRIVYEYISNAGVA